MPQQFQWPFFPKYITIVSITLPLVVDAASAIGTQFGRARFRAKSLEGSAGFFLVALVVMFLLPKIGHSRAEYFIGVVAYWPGL